MKYTTLLFCLLSLSPIPGSAQAAATLGEPVVTERGAHYRKIETVTERLTSYFRTIRVTNSFVELATSMHYCDDQGNWAESRALIELFPPDAAMARHGPMQVIFPSLKGSSLKFQKA